MVVFDELINRHEAAPHSDNQVLALNFQKDLLLEIRIDALGLPDKQALGLFDGVAAVDEISQTSINEVILHWQVHKVDPVHLVPVLDHFFKFHVSVLQLHDQLLILVVLVHFLLQLLFHGLDMLLRNLVLLFQETNFVLVDGTHPCLGLNRSDHVGQLQVLARQALDDAVFVFLLRNHFVDLFFQK